MKDAFRHLPSVDRLLTSDPIKPLRDEAGEAVTDLIRHVLYEAREAIGRGNAPPDDEEITKRVIALARLVLEPSLQPVINASGVIIHTNLGRAPLSSEALESMAAVLRGYSNLEFDLESGERGSRRSHLERAICQLTGAEAALVVNNNASALLLALSALAEGREVIVSRGQAVEIGGGFRIPDVMRQSGAQLVEVGTTNRTYVRDYQQAITERTAAIMRVHASNFRVVGFTASPSLQEIARVAKEHGVPLIDDVGSGCLLDTTKFGLAPEPMVQDSLANGADLCLFSGDKLLGGPQAGIVAGKRELVDQLARHPLARALRLDKASIAGLHATLLHYLRGEALEKVPVWRMISMPIEEIERRARRWKRAIAGSAVADGVTMVGGGSMPGESLPTHLLSIRATDASELARRLRTGKPPVIGRIQDGALLFDPRTVLPGQDRELVAALQSAIA